MWELPDGSAWAQTARDGETFYVRVSGFAEFRITARSVQVRANPGARASTIRHLLLDQVLPLAMASEGHLVLHASAVHRAGAGIIALAGAAGTGKSTLAASLGQEGWDVVSDDGVVVERNDRGPIAIPAYAGLRLWPDAAEATGLTDAAVVEVAEYSAKVRVTTPRLCPPAPLRAVYIIGPGDACGIAPLGSRDAAMALIRHAYRAEPARRMALAAQLEACAALASQVLVSRAIVPRDLSQLGRAAAVVSAHATFAPR